MDFDCTSLLALLHPSGDTPRLQARGAASGLGAAAGPQVRRQFQQKREQWVGVQVQRT